MHPEIFLPFAHPRPRVPPVTEVRSTLITSSIQAIRRHGYFEDYERQLDSANRAAVLECIAGTWLPLAVARAHYLAMDGLHLSSDEIIAMGSDVSQHTIGTFMASLTKLATASGLTPWTALMNMDRLMGRMFVGGGVEVQRRGPKDAQVEFVAIPLFDVGYLRTAFRGFVQAAGAPLAQRFLASEVTERCSPTALVLMLSWA